MNQSASGIDQGDRSQMVYELARASLLEGWWSWMLMVVHLCRKSEH